MAKYKHLKLDFLQSSEMLDVFNKLCDKAKQYWLNCLYALIREQEAEQALHFIWKTQILFSDNLSPIEQIFAVCFVYLLHSYNIDDKIKCFSQHKVNIGDTFYFLDFYVEFCGAKYAIELDGYKYHSTKSQINHDYEREQNLNELGYKVLRFTGSQIYNSAFKSAAKVLKIILKNSENKNAE